jgi:hypothetical protein
MVYKLLKLLYIYSAQYRICLSSLVNVFIYLMLTLPIKAEHIDFLEKVLSEKEFQEIVEDSTNIPPSCGESLNSQKWFEQVKEIQVHLNVDKYYRNIFKKLENMELGVGNQNNRIWSKYQKSKIQFFNSDCKYEAQLRLTGDLSDHIGFPTNFPHSIKVKLKDDRVGNITKFKLLNPKTRGGKYELLNVLIHKELGFIAPRTALVNVKIGGEIYKALFQEDITKELLEHNGLHEAIMIEGDEGYRPFTNPKIANLKLINGDYFNAIARDVLEILSRVYLKTNQDSLNFKKSTFFAAQQGDRDQPLLIDYLPMDSQANFVSFHLLNYALMSRDGLSRDDHRIVYDHISRKFSPIFYDGHYKPEGYSTDVNFSFTDQQRRLLINDLQNMDLDKLHHDAIKLGADFYKSDIMEVLRIATEFLENATSKKVKSKIEELSKEFDEEQFLLAGSKILFERKNLQKTKVSWLTAKEFLKTCLISKTKINCNLEHANMFDYPMQPQDPRSSLFLHGFDEDTIDAHYSAELSNNTSLIGETGTFIEHTDNLKVITDKIKKTIIVHRITENQDTAQIRISGGYLDGWDIKVNEDTSLGFVNLKGSRASEFGLTGCVTFNDIKLSAVSVSVNNSNCEDSVHFVRTTGDLLGIKITDAENDAIDADFSNLTFNNISIRNAGNDCFDVSAGKYIINSGVFFNCKDKGISAGEGSKVHIDNIIINNALIGIVSKDGSKLSVISSNINKSKICFAVYRKKQEFGGGIINVGHKAQCNGLESFIQKGSTITNLD